MLDLTDEQKEVVRAVNDAHYITVQAYAGAGKTSTILEIARTYPRKRFLVHLPFSCKEKALFMIKEKYSTSWKP